MTMARHILRTGLPLTGFLVLVAQAAAAPYHTNRELESVLREVAGADRQLFSLSVLAKNNQDASIWIMRVGSDSESEPAVLVVAGLDGRHLLGTEMAVALLETLAADPDSTHGWLRGRTLYVIPRLNLHGADAFFDTTLRAETAGVRGEGDWDRDGLVGEDPYDDLDGDGQITLVRVRDPEGKFVMDGEQHDLLRPAEPKKGDRAQWRVLTEGSDDDGDEAWNEEADGGVNLARNFPQGYEWFSRNAGPHQVSEIETRAVANFLVGHPNLAAVVVFGFEDNLLTPPSKEETSDPELVTEHEWEERAPVEHINKHDLPLLQHIGEIYRKDMGVGKTPDGHTLGVPRVRFGEVGIGAGTGPDFAAQGGLARYVYFARGRLALATPVWTPGVQIGRLDPATRDEEDARSEQGEVGKAPKPTPEEKALRGEEAFRAWLVSVDSTAWLGWTPIEHPDFPGKEAYVGGYAPFAGINPPPSVVEECTEPHLRLIRRLFDQLPHLRILDAELKPLGGDAHELSVRVQNTGYLPDVLAHGVFSRNVRPTRIEVTVPEESEVLGGTGIVILDRVPGSGGIAETKMVVQLRGRRPRVDVWLVSEVGGRDRVSLTPGERVEGRP